MRPSRYALTLPALLILAARAAQAQGGEPLPSAADIVARYVTAIGGREAVLKHQSVRSTGTVEMPAAGISGSMVAVQAAPNRTAVTMTIAGMGDIVTAFDGTTGWSVNPMQGPRLLEGRELDQLREEAGLESMVRTSASIKSMDVLGKSEMGGRACYRVHVVFASGRERVECYDVESGLLDGIVAKQESAMGTMEVTSLVSDYKDFGGVKTATTVRQQAGPQELVMKIVNVEYDRPDDAAAFTPPAAVQALINQATKKP